MGKTALVQLTGVEYVVASDGAWEPNPDPHRGIFAPWNTRVTCS